MSKLFLSILISFIILVNLQSQSLWNGQGHIPQAYQLEWTTAGLLANTPKTADHVYTVTDPVFDDGDNSNYDGEINNAINSAKNDGGVSIIYFSSGDYNLTSMIELDKTYNNIIFQGAGSEETTLIFAVGSGNYCFYIQGDIDESNHIDVQNTLAKDQVNVTGDKSFSTYYDSDKWIWLRQNDYVGHGDDRWADYSVGQINKIVSYSGNNATLAYKASKDYSSSNDIYIYNIDPVLNIGIENLKIYRNESGSSSSGSNIFFKYAVNCWVKGVESSNTCRHHVDVQQSSHIYVSGCYLHHANDYGGYGRGYGVVLNISTTNCLVENNIFKTLRHAMTVQAGANCNVFTYNYSRDQEWTNGFWADLLGDDGPDICIHGNYSYGNLFEHNMVELIVADDPHGANGPYNAFVRNYSKDSDGVFHYMILYNAPYSSVLGCELRCDELYQPIMQSGTTNLVTDLWGKVATTDPDHNTYETAFWHTHESLARNLGIWDYGELLDNS